MSIYTAYWQDQCARTGFSYNHHYYPILCYSQRSVILLDTHPRDSRTRGVQLLHLAQAPLPKSPPLFTAMVTLTLFLRNLVVVAEIARLQWSLRHTQAARVLHASTICWRREAESVWCVSRRVSVRDKDDQRDPHAGKDRGECDSSCSFVAACGPGVARAIGEELECISDSIPGFEEGCNLLLRGPY